MTETDRLSGCSGWIDYKLRHVAPEGRTDERAYVWVSVTAEIEGRDDESDTTTVELACSSGEWKIWSVDIE